MLYLTRGIQTNPIKVEAIWKWPIPTNVTEVHSSLGFTNYYHKFIKKYAQVANLYINWFQMRMWQENIIQLSGILSVRTLLTNLKNCALAHQFWHMQILWNHLNYMWMQASSVLELSYIKNKMELKRLLVMPVNHYPNQNQNIPSISWNFFAWNGQ